MDSVKLLHLRQKKRSLKLVTFPTECQSPRTEGVLVGALEGKGNKTMVEWEEQDPELCAFMTRAFMS